MVKYRRIKPERIKKYLVSIGAVSLPLAMGLFIYLSSINAITILSFSNDTTCAGTLEDPCIAELAFHANTNIYIYPNETWLFSTDKKLKLLKLQRSWGNSWRTINLNKTWSSKVKYAIKFSKGKDYKIRFVAEKYVPYQDIKWSFGEIDPVFKGIKLDYNVTNLKNSKAIKLNLSQDYNLSLLAKLQGKKPSDYLNIQKTKYFGDVDVRLMERVNVTKQRVKRTYDCNCTNETYNFTDNQTNKTTKKIREVCKTCYIYENYTQEVMREINPENYILSKNKPIYELKKNGLKIVDLLNGKFGYAVWTDIFVLGQKLENCSWFNQSWLYRMPINLSNTAGNLTNYQVKIELNSSNFDYSHADDTGKDIRFTNSTDDLLDYWIESWNTSGSSYIWVNVTSLTNNANTTIYMYYGNSRASSETDFDNTFTKDYGESGLKGLWHMDDGVSPTADDSGNGNNGTITGATWVGSDGGQWANRSDIKFSTGDSLSFDGVDDYVPINSDVGNGIRAVSLWFKSPTIIDDSTAVTQALIYRWDTGGGNYGNWGLNWWADDGRLQFLRLLGTTNHVLHSDSSVFLADTWYHVVGTIDATNGMELYINGVKQSETDSSTNPTDTKTSNTVIGRWGDYAHRYFNGTIDEVRIYNRSLSAEEIKAHYERRKYASPEPTYTIGSEETSGDTTPPTSNSPSDVSYTQNSQATINWTLTDETGAGNYTILRNGTIQNSSTSWTNNTNLGVWVNTSTIGNNWNYTILFNDSSGNEGTPDSVFINITLAGEPDTNFEIYNGANWVEYNDTNYIEFRCTPTQTNCEPTNQNTGTSQSIFKITNNGTASGNVSMKINQTFTGIDLKCDDDYTSDGAIILTTTYQQIHGTLTNGNSIYVSCWADYNNPTSGGIFEISTNITN